jgi:hypothetical protein
MLEKLFLNSRNKQRHGAFHNIDEKEGIMLELNVLDIYRVDMSCDYLGSVGLEISDAYVNTDKKCARASSLTPINSASAVLASKSTARANKSAKTVYKPLLYNEFHYKPFVNDERLNNKLFKNIRKGGFFTPTLPKSRPCQVNDLENIVFVVPFTRNRAANLALFLINMHKYLKSVNGFSYQILVVEQVFLNNNFNKGRLFNAAVRHIIERQKITKITVDCIVLHDIDILPASAFRVLTERGDYRCQSMPWHLSRKIRSLMNGKETVYSRFLTGGILSLRLEHYTDTNGMSNEYFNWGGEDVSKFICLIFIIFS